MKKLNKFLTTKEEQEQLDKIYNFLMHNMNYIFNLTTVIPKTIKYDYDRKVLMDVQIYYNKLVDALIELKQLNKDLI